MPRRTPAVESPVDFNSIPKCKYAGDTEDDYCAHCNGCYMEENGKRLPCTECTGYEAEEVAKVAEPVVEEVEAVVEEPVAEPEPPRGRGRKPAARPVVEDKPAPKQRGRKPAVKQPEPEVEAEVEPEVVSAPEVTSEPVVSATGDVTIHVTSGCTTEVVVNGAKRWYKFEYSETKTIPADVAAEERAALWEKVNLEVDNQVSALMEDIVG